MDKYSIETVSGPVRPWARRIAVAATAFSIAISVSAQTSWRTAAGSVAAPAQAAPQVVASSSAQGDQTLTYSFPAPTWRRGADGVADVFVSGLDNFGAVGEPELPRLPVRIALPEGRAVASVEVVSSAPALVARGLVLRHAERPIPLSRAPTGAATPRNRAVYASREAYPATPGSAWSTARKNGVDFCELTLCPISYIPASGEVYFLSDITVTVRLASGASAGASGRASARAGTGAASAASAPFLSHERAAGVRRLVDNPAVVDAYAPASSRKAASSRAAFDGETDLFFADPAVPCASSNQFTHVIVTTEELKQAFVSLALYRRRQGVSSTVVTLEKIRGLYPGKDSQARIRAFIQDAYATWGTKYVVLGGDAGQIPVRLLHAEAVGEVDELPSDLYYQCLDGDFDANGNGVYGEVDDKPDLYAEVAIGRVSAETPEEALSWLSKAQKYDADCVSGLDYTRGSLFAGEHMGDGVYAKPLLELIREGSANYQSDGLWGFGDVPLLFDVEKEQTLYEADKDWEAADIAYILNGDTVSIVNHLGHSNADSNMQMSNAHVDGLRNKCPFFVYSQGCIAGAIDEDCIAEHFTTSTGSGAFAGVWNSRYGWYQPSDVIRGPSAYFHRHFIDALFRQELVELGLANQWSHERCAPMVNEECMRWCYYETNLFGDPMQRLGGSGAALLFDREAYKSSATARVTYYAPDAPDDAAATVDVVFAVERRNWRAWTDEDCAVVSLPLVSPQTVSLAYVGESGDGRFLYEGEVSLADFAFDEKDPVLATRLNYEYVNALGEKTPRNAPRLLHDDVITVSLADGSAGSDTAVVDDVAPAFRDVRIRNADEGLVLASWSTYEPDKSPSATGDYAEEDTACDLYMDVVAPFADPVSHPSPQYKASHSLSIGGLADGAYFVRIVAADKAGNTNVWCSASVTDAIVSPDPADYGGVIVARPTERMAFDFETDASSWTVEGDGCWELGAPSYGPVNASRCYGTVLDGRYPDGANASLVSPPVKLRDTPALVFRHWYDIERTPDGKGNLGDADYGIVEVIATAADGSYTTGAAQDGGWHNVLPYARENPREFVQGASDGWEEVRILLPEEYENKTVRLRFRFVSDTWHAGLGNPAGWYVDNVGLLDLDRDGIALSVDAVDDSEGGNGDGIVQPGETFKVRLASANLTFDRIVIPDGGASVAVSLPGLASGALAVTGGSPVALTYPVFQPGVRQAANEWIEIHLDPSVPYGASIELAQTLVGQDGRRYDAVVRIPVENPCAIRGRVVQPTGYPVIGATVSVNTSEGDYAYVTESDGAFEIAGLSSNRVLRLTASYGDASAGTTATAPATDVEIVLPLAEIHVSPESIEETMETEEEDKVVALTLSNAFIEAAADGNAGPSCDLEYEIAGLTTETGAPLEWVKLLSPAKGRVEPDGAIEIQLQLHAKGVDTSIPHKAFLILLSNAWNGNLLTIPVSLDIENPDLHLDADHVETEEWGTLYIQGERKFDGDGLLEKGEAGNLIFFIHNPDPYETVQGFLGYADCSEVAADFSFPLCAWGTILPGATEPCESPVSVTDWTLGPGETATVTVSGTAIYASGKELQQDLVFEITGAAYNVATGRVVTVNCAPVSPVGATNPVENAVVELTGSAGDRIESPFTKANGAYSVSGLVPGEKYWVSVRPAESDRHTVAPPGFLLTAEENADSGEPAGIALTNDLVGTLYSWSTTNNAHLRLHSVTVVDEDGDGRVGFGETFSLAVAVWNDGARSTITTNIAARLTLPDEFERDPCMELLQGEDAWLHGIPNSNRGEEITAVFANFQARSFDYGDCAEGDYQRFCLEVYEDVPEGKHWYFDFTLPIFPRYTISGMVENAAGGTVRGTRLVLEGTNGTYLAETTLTNDAAYAAYTFTDLAAGEYTVRVAGLPLGYVCEEPSELTQEIVSEDWLSADFTLVAWAVSGDIAEEAADGAGGIRLEIREGESRTLPFGVVNGGDEEAEVAVAVRYNRRDAEVLSLEQADESLAAAKAALAARLGDDWTRLDPAVFNASELEVTFRPGTSVAARDAYLARHGLVATYHFTTIPASIAVPGVGASAAGLASAALASPASFRATADDDVMVSIQPSVVCHQLAGVDLPPADPLYYRQWALNNTRQDGGTLGADIGAEKAWAFLQGAGSSEIRVAITDTGIDFTHPDLAANWTGLGWNYVNNTSDVRDQNGHGTHVAGIVGAVGGNGIGVAGVNWNVGLVACRICMPGLFGDVWASSAQIARSYEESYAKFGCCVNNNSWGTPLYSQILKDAMERAQDYGMIFVVAAGNTADDIDVVPSYPANYSQWLDNVIVVAAADSDDNLASFSSYSAKLVHLAAPGVNVLSTYPGIYNGGALPADAAPAAEGAYMELDGTSMASPYVAGAVALLRSASPQASYGAIRDALFNGVRKDPGLAEFVSTSGHLDIGNSVRLLGRQWLRFGPAEGPVVLVTNVTVAAGASATLDLVFNDPPDLPAGEYSATLVLSSGLAGREVPVELDVEPGVLPKVQSVEVFDEAAPDGRCAPGEEASLRIVLKNVGLLEFENLSAELVGVSGEVLQGSSAYGYLPGNDTTDPALEFRVRFPASGEMAEYTLKVCEDGELVAELPVEIALFDGQVVKVTVTDGGAPVAGAVVEALGASAARAVTDDSGVAYLAVPTADATTGHTLRVLADSAVRHVDEAFNPAAGDVAVSLSHATLEPAGGATLDLSLAEGMALETNLVLSASASGALPVRLVIARRGKVAVIDDGTGAEVLTNALARLGFDVDYYPENYQVVRYVNPASSQSEIRYSVRHSWDDALVFKYDAVVAVLTGAAGTGRLLIDPEAKAYADFVERGGRVFLAGNAPLSRPDNLQAAELLGLAESACSPVAVAEAQARAAAGCPGAPFVELAAGDAFPAAPGAYDDTVVSNRLSGVTVAEVEDPEVSKLHLSAPSASGGQAALWNGSVSDLLAEGAARDILRGYLYDSLVKDAGIDWLTASAETLSAAPGSQTTVTLSVNSARALGVGDYEANLVLLADVDGVPVVPVSVNLSVTPPVIRAYNGFGSVVDWGGRPLRGSGGPDSCILQLVYAGPDGAIDPPGPDGQPTGDDLALAVSGSSSGFAYFGSGDHVQADAGRFDVDFGLSFEGYEPGLEGVMLYVRAWDAASVASAVAYGDSELHEVTYADGLPEAIDFGSWTVGQARDNLSDLNGDSIPDAWLFEYRPDLDPRASAEALETAVDMPASNSFGTAIAAASYNAEGNPARVFAAGNYIVVLEQYTHRIAVHDRASPYGLVTYYGATAKNGEASNHTNEAYAVSAADGAFNQPFGLALDIYGTNTYRFAVADKGNNRVQLFSLDPATGLVTFLAKYGTQTAQADLGNGAPAGTLSAPLAVAFMKGGDLLVSDSENYRVLRLRTTGNAFAYKAQYNFTDQSVIYGLCYGKDGQEGFWAADGGRQKQNIGFYHTAGFSSDPLVSLGTQDDQEFVSPRDVQLWDLGGRTRVLAVDYQGSRIRMLEPLANAKGVYTGLVAVADIGSYSDISLQDYEKVYRPNGVFPVAGTNQVYVADYGHNRVTWFSLVLDLDGDGMDDIWEDLNGLDSTRDDSMEDADGDGLLNLGEYRVGTDPRNTDSDGDGAGDHYEMYQLTDPLDPDSTPEKAGASVISVVATPEQIGVGESVTLVATLDRAIEGSAEIRLFAPDGTCFVATAPAVDGATATYVYTADGAVRGLIDARFTFADCDPPATNVAALFEIVVPDAEEYKEEWWHIDSITIADEKATLTWAMPTAEDGLSSDGKCDFRIDWRTSLTEGAWSASPDSFLVEGATSAADCTTTISLTDIGSPAPASCFFRLFWTNKVKE